jgi:hypothetical protein
MTNPLNEMQTKVFIAIADDILSCTGGEFGFIDEVDIDAIGITRRQFSGYCGSIAKKGDFYSTCDDEYHQTQLTEAGAALYTEITGKTENFQTFR